MAVHGRDLWPRDITAELVAEPTPRDLLVAQAARLYELTKGVLRGEVVSAEQPHSAAWEELLGEPDPPSLVIDGVIHRFNIIAHIPQRYRYHLFYVWHPAADLYPAIVSFGDGGPDRLCDGEETLAEAVAAVLAHDRTRAIIKSLYAQAVSASDEAA